MLTYPWPNDVSVTYDIEGEDVEVIVIIPRVFGRKKVIAVTSNSVLLAQHAAWLEYVRSVGNCRHSFVPDTGDDTPGAGICTRCLSRFDHIMINPAVLCGPDAELTVDDILREDVANAVATQVPRVESRNCRGVAYTASHLAALPVLCTCHGLPEFEPGTYWDAVNVFASLEDLRRDHQPTPEETRAIRKQLRAMLHRADVTVPARLVLLLCLGFVHRAF